MNSEHEFRNKLKGLLDEQNYAYEHFNWEKAKQVLDEEDSKRRRGFFYWILGGSGILAAFLFWYFMGTVTPPHQLSVTTKNSEIKHPQPTTIPAAPSTAKGGELKK